MAANINSNFLINGVDLKSALVTRESFTSTELYTWGAYINTASPVDDSGIMLGSGVATSRSSPIQVSSATNKPLPDLNQVKEHVLWKDILTDIPLKEKDGSGDIHAYNMYISSNNLVFGVGTARNAAHVGVATGYTIDTFRIATTPTLYTANGYPFEYAADNSVIRGQTAISIAAIEFNDYSNFGTGIAVVDTNGFLKAWGASVPDNLPAPTRSYSPVQIGTDKWKKVFGGASTFYGIKYDNTLWTWGNNNKGVAGVNTTAVASYSSPVQIGTSKWSMVSSRKGRTSPNPFSTDVILYQNQVSFGIRSDGGLFVWGLNSALSNDGLTWTSYDYGSHGLNSAGVHRSSPVQIGTSSWSYVSTGGFSTSAIRSDGALFTWGRNTDGQLGLGDQVHRSSPVQVGTSSWLMCSTGETHIAAIRIDGKLFIWGDNAYGQLGVSDMVSRSSPVQVGTSSNWRKISLTSNFSSALVDVDIS